jgi:hypothetical protein
MNKIIVTLSDIKAIKSLVDANQKLKDDNYTAGDYCYGYNGKEELIEANEERIINNVKIIMDLLDVSYCVVMDMVWDFDRAKFILADFYKTAA